MESKQNISSVIARLMGLDELPQQQPLRRPQKVLSEDYLRKAASIGLVGKSSLRVGRVSKKIAQKQDMHLCPTGISKVDKHVLQSLSYKKANLVTGRAEFGFSSQTNSHFKCPACKKVYFSKGLDNIQDDHDATREDLQRSSHHPDLSTKQCPQQHLNSCPFSASMSTNASDYSDTEVYTKPDNMTTNKTLLRSLQKLEIGETKSHIDHLGMLKSQLELKDTSSHPSGRIVVLKPNPGRVQTCARDRKYTHQGEVRPKNRKIDIVVETAGTITDLEPSRHSIKATREDPKKTFQKGSQNTNSSRRGLSRSRVPVDKSSEALMISAQSSFFHKRNDQISYPFPSKSIFTREAKKQIFERWKTAKNFQDVEMACGRCTLGEMFAMHDGGAGLGTLCLNVGKHGSVSPFGPLSENPQLRSSSHTASGTPKFMAIHDAFQYSCSDKHEGIAEKHCKLNRKTYGKEDILETRDLRLNCKKTHNKDAEINHNIAQSPVVLKLSSHNVSPSGSNDDLPFQVSPVIQNESKFNYIQTEAEHSSIAAISNLSAEGLTSQNLFTNAELLTEVSSENQLCEISPSIFLAKDALASSDSWDDLTPQRSLCGSPRREISSCTSDSDLAMKLDSINQSSPDSVLERPFGEENTFSSECSGSPVADLSGLAMKLLDSESIETNSETSEFAVSIDEDTEKASLDLSRDNEKRWGVFRPEESRDFSYLIDVLDQVCLFDSNLNLCCEKWHAKEYAISPLLFETLEKKYGKQTSWMKSDRRLLFDRINSALCEILSSFTLFQMSAKPLRRRFNTSLRRDEIEEELWMLLLNQEKEVGKDLPEKALGRDMKWFELEEDISIICKEIEEILFDELAGELDIHECS